MDVSYTSALSRVAPTTVLIQVNEVPMIESSCYPLCEAVRNAVFVINVTVLIPSEAKVYNSSGDCLLSMDINTHEVPLDLILLSNSTWTVVFDNGYLVRLTKAQ